jgi:hypothetical protein
MRKIVLTFLLAISVVALTNAQDYKTGIGLRGGFANGLTIKHFVSGKSAFEGIISTSTKWGGYELTVLYEIHNRAFNVENLNWYFGFGGHIGSYDADKLSSTIIGIDGVLGIEYNFSEAPINIGLDWMPVFNIVGDSNFWGDRGALSIRYIF